MPWSKTATGIIYVVFEHFGSWLSMASLEAGLEQSRLIELAEFGAVYLNDSRITNDFEVGPDDYLRVHTEPHRYPRLNVPVVYENSDLVIVDKPCRIPCHPTLDNLKENVISYVSENLGLALLPTHRLDTATSGLLVLAKNASAQIEFQKLLSERKILKKYQALVASPGISVGLYEHHMEKTSYAPKTIWEVARPNTQICQLKVLSNSSQASHSKLEIELITGRTHQIRAQLAFMGFPILNDSLYRDGNELEIGQIELRCQSLSFQWNSEPIQVSL